MYCHERRRDACYAPERTKHRLAFCSQTGRWYTKAMGDGFNRGVDRVSVPLVFPCLLCKILVWLLKEMPCVETGFHRSTFREDIQTLEYQPCRLFPAHQKSPEVKYVAQNGLRMIPIGRVSLYIGSPKSVGEIVLPLAKCGISDMTDVLATEWYCSTPWAMTKGRTASSVERRQKDNELPRQAVTGVLCRSHLS